MTTPPLTDAELALTIDCADNDSPGQRSRIRCMSIELLATRADRDALRVRVTQLAAALGEACDTIDAGCRYCDDGGLHAPPEWRTLAARGQPPTPVGKSRPLPPTFPPPPDRCPACNWSNGNLLNYGVPGESLWLCHGCAARRIRGDGPFERPPAQVERPLTVLDALRLPEVRSGEMLVRWQWPLSDDPNDVLVLRYVASSGWLQWRECEWRRPGSLGDLFEFEPHNLDAACTLIHAEVTP